MNELYHHGTEGQKWGVRNGPPYPLDAAGKAAVREQRRRNKINVGLGLNAAMEAHKKMNSKKPLSKEDYKMYKEMYNKGKKANLKYAKELINNGENFTKTVKIGNDTLYDTTLGSAWLIAGATRNRTKRFLDGFRDTFVFGTPGLAAYMTNQAVSDYNILESVKDDKFLSDYVNSKQGGIYKKYFEKMETNRKMG